MKMYEDKNRKNFLRRDSLVRNFAPAKMSRYTVTFRSQSCLLSLCHGSNDFSMPNFKIYRVIMQAQMNSIFWRGDREKMQHAVRKTFTFISSIPCLHTIIPTSIQHVYIPPACFRLEVCRIGRCGGQNSPSNYVVILNFQDLNHLAIFLQLHALTRSTMEHHTWHPKSCKLQSASRTLFHPPRFWSHDMHKCPTQAN